MAFLDIMPLSPGHLLVTTRRHHEKISDVSEEESRELGLWLPRLSRVLANVTGVWDWNIVQNNGILALDTIGLFDGTGLLSLGVQAPQQLKWYPTSISTSSLGQHSLRNYETDPLRCLEEVREVSLMTMRPLN
jgi:hypothetical protein